MNRRDFLINAYKLGGAAALLGLGVSYAEARNIMIVVPSRPLAAAPSECDGHLVCQNLETATTGWDNSETWSVVEGAGGTVDPVYTTSPAPLRGTQSLYVGATAYNESYAESPAFTAGSPRYIFFQYSLLAVGTDTGRCFELLDASNNVLVFISVQTSRALLCRHGTSEDYGSTLTLEANNFIWVEYTKGTGANGVLNVYLSATKTKPGSADMSITNGTVSADADKIRLTTYYQLKSVYDRILVSSSSIGSVPD